MPDNLPKVTLDHFWLVKRYLDQKGEPFTFFWGLSTTSLWDAFMQVRKDVIGKEEICGTNEVVWKEQGNKECRLVRSSTRPDCFTTNFSVRDDQIRKPLPKQICFKL